MARENKWRGFDGPGYILKNKGRPAVFLIPAKKLKLKLKSSKTVEREINDFLAKNFGAFSALHYRRGVWRSDQGKLIFDKSVEYEVSFNGKNKIPVLAGFLAKIARAINEDCIYLKAGQYSSLLYPRKNRS